MLHNLNGKSCVFHGGSAGAARTVVTHKLLGVPRLAVSGSLTRAAESWACFWTTWSACAGRRDQGGVLHPLGRAHGVLEAGERHSRADVGKRSKVEDSEPSEERSHEKTGNTDPSVPSHGHSSAPQLEPLWCIMPGRYAKLK
jgi:hypothetical protein